MSMPLWFYNLAVYCAQLAVLIAAGALMVNVTRLCEPRLRLIYWQLLLALGVLLPAIEPWQAGPQIEQGKVQAGESLAHAGSAGIEAAAALSTHAASSFSIYEIVALLVLAGFLVRLVWVSAGLLRLRRSRLHACPLGPHAAAERFKVALGVSPAVLISGQISSPATFGWRKPRILLPKKFIQMDEARQRAVLCHEFVHVRRRDWLWHVAEEILRSLFWFHLAVAWLIAQIRLCREQIVDREVVILAGSRRAYLDALFEIASSPRTSRNSPALLFLSERHLKRRVKLILKEVTMSRKKLILALSTSLCGLLVTGAIATTLLPLKSSAAQAPSTVALKAPTVRPDTHFYGNPEARVTVVEFGDFECPACRKAESVAEQVRKNLGGRVRFGYRQFPLTLIHHDAEKAAEAAECAGEQGKFWQAVNYLSDHALDFSNAGVRQFAAGLGLEQARTIQCLSSGAMAARVQQDIRDARALGIHSVPTFFVGKVKFVGTPTYSQLHALIEQKLHADGDAQRTTSNDSNLLAAASLAPTFPRELNGQEAGTPSPRPSPAKDPPTQGNQDASADANKNHKTYVNQAEVQRQLDEAIKQAKIAQDAASKIDQKKIQEQIEEAMRQEKVAQKNFAEIDQAKIQQQIDEAMKKAQIAQEAASKIDQAKIQRQVDAAMKQLQKVDTPEMRRKYEEAMKQFQKMNTPEMRRGYEEALKQLKTAQITAPKIDQAKLREQIEQAMEQAKMAQQDAAKVNKAEIQRQLDEMKKQIEQARKETEAARKEVEKAHQKAMKDRRGAEGERKAAKPEPPAAPAPPPPAPPSASALPAKPPEAAGIANGVPSGVASGVIGGKAEGIPGGHVIGVPGGVVGGVITPPQPPEPASKSHKVARPPAPAATPVPPSPEMVTPTPPSPVSPAPPPPPQN